MKIFLDTNIIIDLVLNRHPWVRYELVLLELSRQKKLSLAVSDISFLNLAYAVRKVMSPDDIYAAMTDLLKYMDVAAADGSVIRSAVSLRWKDLEDCVQYLVARKESADYIITRDLAGFSLSDIPVMTPVEFLSIIL